MTSIASSTIGIELINDKNWMGGGGDFISEELSNDIESITSL